MPSLFQKATGWRITSFYDDSRKIVHEYFVKGGEFNALEEELLPKQVKEEIKKHSEILSTHPTMTKYQTTVVAPFVNPNLN